MRELAAITNLGSLLLSLGFRREHDLGRGVEQRLQLGLIKEK
jgi:hypothetical protein